MRNHLVNHFIENLKVLSLHKLCLQNLKKSHEMAEQGKPLHAQVFSEIYEKLFKEYNGDSLVFDEEVKYGWARIPHFYRPFYVYKYATGFASAIQIADKLLSGDPNAQKNYIEFLKGGSSDYPLNLLKKLASI